MDSPVSTKKVHLNWTMILSIFIALIIINVIFMLFTEKVNTYDDGTIVRQRTRFAFGKPKQS